MKNADKLARYLWLTGIVFGLAASQLSCTQTNAGRLAKAPEQVKTATSEARTEEPGGQVEMCLSLVSFDRKDLEAVTRKSPRASLRAADVLALWRAGKGRLEMTTTTRASNGEEFTIKDVTEWRYPQTYELFNPEPAVVAPTNTSHVPEDFNTREIGMIFKFTASWHSAVKIIRIDLTPELSSKLDTEEATYKLISPAGTNAYFFPQPTFQSKSMTVKTTCADGETIIYNCDMVNQGKHDMTYLLITPHLIKP